MHLLARQRTRVVLLLFLTAILVAIWQARSVRTLPTTSNTPRIANDATGVTTAEDANTRTPAGAAAAVNTPLVPAPARTEIVPRLTGDPASRPTATQTSVFRQLTQARMGKRTPESEPALHDPGLYRFRPGTGADGKVHQRALNPLNDLEADFASEVIRFVAAPPYPVLDTDHPLSADRAARLNVRFTGYGTGTAMQSVQPGAFATTADRVDRPHGSNIVEWWKNSAAGFEQGFVVNAPLDPASPAQALRFEFSLESPFSPVFDESRQELVFQMQDGTRALTYGNIVVTDANAAPVPVHLEVGEMTRDNGDNAVVPIALVVDASRATYPLTVDPLISSQLVADINPQLTDGPYSPATDGRLYLPPHVTAGGKIYFAAFTESEGFELWISDGTPGGTKRLKDIAPGTASSFPHEFVAVGSEVYFAAFERDTGTELWKTDGTESGTVLVKDIHVGTGSSDPVHFAEVGGTMFFTASGYDGVVEAGNELWKSDGTSLGTVLVKDIFAGTGSSDPEQLIDVAGTLFFVAHGHDGVTNTGRELWKSNGTETGTSLVKDILPGTDSSAPLSLIAAGPKAFFFSGTFGKFQLWTSDGTEAGTLPLKDIAASFLPLASLDGTVFFFPISSALWKSDGTISGTRLVADLPSETDYYPFAPQSISRFGGALYFASSPDHNALGLALWTSDGSPAGTNVLRYVVRDFSSIGDSLLIDEIIKVPGPRWDNFGGVQQLLGDGTPAGTVPLATAIPALEGKWLSGAVPLNGIDSFLFVGVPGKGPSLWRTDSSPQGAVQLADFTSFTDGSDPRSFSAIGANLYFVAFEATHEFEIWKTDGTEVGTTRVSDIIPGAAPQQLTAVENTLFFIAAEGDRNTRFLWKSDGTPTGTVPVANTFTRNTADHLTAVGTLLFFSASTLDDGIELWRSDGTETGTFMVKDIAPGTDSSRPVGLTNVSGTLFFSANAGTNGGPGLWKSDGTEAGTVLVKDLGSSPLADVDGTLFFVVNSSPTGSELWKSDGTTEGTVLVKHNITLNAGFGLSNLTNHGGMMFFSARSNDGLTDTGFELWKSDGTEAGTVLVKDIFLGAGSSDPTSLVSVGGTLFFAAHGNDGINDTGIELWKSDGTEAGTVVVKDIASGSFSANPSSLINLNGVLYFSTQGYDEFQNPVTGLWRSDGTAAGTVMIEGPDPSHWWVSPSYLLRSGNQFVFTVDDGVHGKELHTLPVEGADPRLTWEDIGGPAVAGAQLYYPSLSAHRIRAGGGDMWGAHDEFRFGHAMATGDGELIVYVDNLSGPFAWSRIGLTFRESLAADAAHASVIATVDHGVDVQWRATAGGASSHLPAANTGNPTPVHLKLVRAGNQFTGYRSNDGVTWSLVGSTTVVLPPTVHVGIIACAVSADALMTADVGSYHTDFPASEPAPTLALAGLSQVYNGTPRVVTVTTDPAGLGYAVTYDGGSTPPTNAGSYAVVASLTDPTHPGTATATLAIAKASQTITFPELPDVTFGDPLDPLGASASSRLPVAFSVVTGPASVTATTLNTTGAGTVTVRAAQTGDGNHLAAPSIDRSFHVAKQPVSVVLSDLIQTFSGAPRHATAGTTPSGLTVDFTYDGSTTPPTHAGSYAVVATVREDNYIGSTSGTLTIAKATASVTLSHLAQNYDGSSKSVEVTTDPSGLPITLTYHGSTVAPSAIGSYDVIATVVDSNYTGSATGTLVIASFIPSCDHSEIEPGHDLHLSSGWPHGNGAKFRWQVRRSHSRALGTGGVAADTDWVDVPGATDADLVLLAAQRFDSGDYRVVVTDGGAEFVSDAIAVEIPAPVPSTARLLNLSTRALSQTSDQVLIPGFVIQGTASKRLLIRAVGPTLGQAPFNIPGVLPNPRINLLRRNGAGFDSIAVNDDWRTNSNAADISTTAASLFAFAADNDREAALLLDLPPGEYTVVADGVGGTTGLAIVELYDADTATTGSQIMNISNRGFAGVGDAVMIPGFAISAEGSKTVLLRVVGPTLAGAPYHVSGTMADPKLTVYRTEANGSDTPILTNDNWGDNPDAATTAQTAINVGAFALTAGSKDAAFVVTLPPGGYTVVGSSADSIGTGVVLVEVYVVP